MAGTEFVVAIVAAPGEPHHQALMDELNRRTGGLAQAGERLVIVDESDADAKPDVAVVLCSGSMTAAAETMIVACQGRDIPLFPVVADRKRFGELAPKMLRPLNGFELQAGEGVGELAGLVLEALRLQRSRRKLFISYARAESMAIANQLREAFTARWYTVFHDTVSILPGRDFQEVLKQELADSDVMLVLNSPGIEDRPYVQKEIEFASQVGVSGVQVVWPNVNPLREALFTRVDLAEPGRLRPGCRRIPLLSRDGIATILAAVADGRTADQERREREFFSIDEGFAKTMGWGAVMHHGRYIELLGPTPAIRLPFVMGAPTSLELEERADWNEGETARVVYDPLGLARRQVEHLKFLSGRLPITFLNYRAAMDWKGLP